jgi:hypothetical protein
VKARLHSIFNILVFPMGFYTRVATVLAVTSYGELREEGEEWRVTTNYYVTQDYIDIPTTH